MSRLKDIKISLLPTGTNTTSCPTTTPTPTTTPITTTPTTTTPTTTTTTGSCEDVWQDFCLKCNAKKCKRNNRCKKNCKNTCNICEDGGSSEECEDNWPENKCKKCSSKKCKKGKRCMKNCKNTCNICDDRTLAFDPFY